VSSTAETIPKASPAKVSHGLVFSHWSAQYPSPRPATTLMAHAVPTQNRSPIVGERAEPSSGGARLSSD